MKKLILLLLLIASPVFAAAPSRVNTYTAGETILSADVTANEDAIFNYLQAGVDTYSPLSIKNADVFGAANIQSDKLNLTSIAQDVTITSGGSFTNNGSTTFNGNMTIGDAIGDTLTIDAGTWTNTNAVTWTLSGALTVSGTIADLGAVTTADINGGTVNSISSFGMTTINNITDIVDEDTMSSDSAQNLATQQSIKAYVDNSVKSNVIYTWTGFDELTGAPASTDNALAFGTTQTLDGTAGENMYYVRNVNNSTSYVDIGQEFRWTKVAGIDTLTVNCRSWGTYATATSYKLRLNVGGGSATGDSTTISGSSPAWITAFTVDVSGLSNGTTYSMQFQRANEQASGNITVALSTIIIERSG